MKARETIERFRRQFADLPFAQKQSLLAFHVGLSLLTDCVDFAQLADGRRLRDAIDFSAWLRELEAAAELAIRNPVAAKTVCHRCGHSHPDGECEVEMGGAGKCGCKAEVLA